MVLRENGSDGQRPERRICLRVYRPEEVQCLRQILVLRKLRVPLKEIVEILNDPGPATAISVFEKNLLQMDDENKALQAVRDAVEAFMNVLKERRALPAGKVILQDSRLLAIVDALSPLIHIDSGREEKRSWKI